MAVVAISCVLAVAIALGAVLFIWTMWRLKAGKRRPNLAVQMNSISHVPARHDTSLAKDPSISPIPPPRKLSRDHTYDCLTSHVHNRALGLNNVVKSQTMAEIPPSATNTDGDLPYGYISPLDINTPQSRENKYTTVEPQLPPSLCGPSSVLSTSDHSQNDYLRLLHR